MKRLQPVIWTKGTFLTPQHLQAQDRFLEDTLQFRLQALRFCAWGFSELVIDQEKLATGHFAISRASGIFPDGLLFEIPDAHPVPASKTLADVFEPKVKSLDVYLTVPNYRQRGQNIAIGQRDSGARYVAEVAAFRDENTGITEKPVQVARKNLRFMVEGENREGNSALRIANVEKTEGDTFRLNPRFVPPLLDIRASEYVQGILRGMIEVLPRAAASCQVRAGRRTRVLPTSRPPTLRISGCSTPSTQISLCSAICLRPSRGIPRNFFQPCWSLPARSPLSRPSSGPKTCRSTITIIWGRFCPIWTINCVRFCKPLCPPIWCHWS